MSVLNILFDFSLSILPPIILSFIHSFGHSFIQLFIYSFIHSFIHPFILSFMWLSELAEHFNRKFTKILRRPRLRRKLLVLKTRPFKRLPKSRAGGQGQ